MTLFWLEAAQPLPNLQSNRIHIGFWHTFGFWHTQIAKDIGAAVCLWLVG